MNNKALQKLSKRQRQENIVNLLQIRGSVTREQCEKINQSQERTRIRDLNELIEKKIIIKQKQKKAVWYELINSKNNKFRPINYRANLDCYLPPPFPSPSASTLLFNSSNQLKPKSFKFIFNLEPDIIHLAL